MVYENSLIIYLVANKFFKQNVDKFNDRTMRQNVQNIKTHYRNSRQYDRVDHVSLIARIFHVYFMRSYRFFLPVPR